MSRYKSLGSILNDIGGTYRLNHSLHSSTLGSNISGSRHHTGFFIEENPDPTNKNGVVLNLATMSSIVIKTPFYIFHLVTI